MDQLLGLALGCMGMSMDDFCRCTPSQFKEAFRYSQELEERRRRGAWSRTRTACLCALQPYSNRRLRAEDVMVFPWEKEGGGDGEGLSKEEVARRFAAAKKRYGLD